MKNLSIPLNGFYLLRNPLLRDILCFELSIPLNGFEDVNVAKLIDELKQAFNSIEWILHHRVPYSLWKVLSFPLRGFYSIKPPGGGSMYMV